MPHTGLEFHPLTYVTERDGVLVGRADTDSYALLPADGAALLRRLAEGTPLPEAEEWYRASFGEPVDMADFVETLHELGFVREPGEPGAGAEGPGTAAPVRYQALGRAAFSPLAWICYALVVAACVVVMVRDPQLRPHGRNLFFSPSLVVVQVVLAFAQMPVVLVHEWFHVLAGRRLGLPTSLGVGRRLYFFVFETRLSGLLGVERRRRYLPFLAGMVADTVLFGALTVLAAVDFAYGPSWVGRFALALAFLCLPRLAWQFLLFLRTDIYYVLVTALGCANLHEVASACLRHRLRGIPPAVRGRMGGLGGPDTWDRDERWTPRERALAPWFALIIAGGVASLLAAAGFLLVPVSVEFVERLGSGLSGGSLGGARFWDSVVAVVIAVLEFAVLPLLAGRKGGEDTGSAPEETESRNVVEGAEGAEGEAA